MNTKLLVKSSLRSMTRYKLRTFFMSFGVAIGVATLVASRSLGIGAEQAMIERVNKLFGSNAIMVGARSPGGGPQGDPITTLEIADLEAIEEQIDAVVAWDPMIVLGNRSVKFEDTQRQVTIYGHSERAEEVWNRGVIEGRSFSKSDLASAARVALIGTRIAEQVFPDSDPIGQQILLDSVPFRIEGILENVGIDPHGTDRDEDIHIPTTTVMRRVLNVDYITSAKILVSDPKAVEATADEIELILRQRHGIGVGESSDFSIFTPRFVQSMIARGNRVLKIFLPAAAGIALLVAAIVIASIMLIAVRERRSEVGLRRAVGATERQIGLQFLLEAVCVTLVSGVLGVGLGIVAVFLVGQRLQMPATVTPESLVLGMAAALLVGIFSGFLPARQAAGLDPVRALQ